MIPRTIRHRWTLIALTLTLLLGASIAPPDVRAQDDTVYLRVMHAALGQPEMDVYLDGEQIVQPLIFGPSYLWSGADFITATFPLPEPSLTVNSLPVAGVSAYAFTTPGMHEIAFTPLGTNSAALIFEAVLQPGRYTVVLVDSADGPAAVLLTDPPPIGMTDAPGDPTPPARYHVVHALAEGTLTVQVDGETLVDDLRTGAAWSETFEPNPGASIKITRDAEPDRPLYAEDRPTKTFLSHVIYTLVAVETAEGPAMLVIATPLIGSSSVSGGDDLTPGGTIEATIAGANPEGGGYVQRDHFITLGFDTVFTVTVEAAEGSALDPFVRIIDVRTGTLLAWNDDDTGESLSAAVRTVFLPAGTYVVSVSGYAFGSAGDYVLRTRAAQ